MLQPHTSSALRPSNGVPPAMHLGPYEENVSAFYVQDYTSNPQIYCKFINHIVEDKFDPFKKSHPACVIDELLSKQQEAVMNCLG